MGLRERLQTEGRRVVDVVLDPSFKGLLRVGVQGGEVFLLIPQTKWIFLLPRVDPWRMFLD